MPGGPGERLSQDDAAILRLESEAIRGHTAKIAILDPGAAGVVDLERLRARVREGAERVDRATERVVVEGAQAYWEEDPAFDVAAHVGKYPDGGPVTRGRLLEIAGELMSSPLDHRRPLWRLDVVSPLEDDRVAVVMRIHHAMADGIAGLRFARAILWDEEVSTAPSEPAAEPGAAAPAHRAEPAGRGRIRTLAHLPGALARELVPRAQDSPLDRRIGSARAVALARARLDDLKRAGADAGQRIGRKVTVNDVLLAAVAGGLGPWLKTTAPGVRRLRVKVPVSLHHRSERADELGNRDSFLYVDLPVAERDPLRRVDLVSAETATRKLRGDADELYSFFHALGHLGAAGRAAGRLVSGPHEFSLSVSNVPGPRTPISVLGSSVRELYSIAEPAQRHALRVSAVSCAGDVGLGLCADPEALGDPAPLAEAIEESLDELARS